MLETSSRLLELLSLLQARREWSGADLADRLEVGPRTIRRDMERLRRLGYPVHATPGVAGGYRLGAGASLPPLLLDEEEAVAVAVGLRTAASGGVAGIEETAVRALAKLEQLLPGRLRRRVGALGAATVPYPATGPTVDPSAPAPFPAPGPARGPAAPAPARRGAPRPRALAPPLPRARRPREPRARRAPPPRPHRPPLVPRRLRHRPRRLADVPGRPDRAAGRD